MFEKHYHKIKDSEIEKVGISDDLQWNRCFARVSFGINSATSSLSSPSQQQPSKFASLWFLSWPTALASSWSHRWGEFTLTSTRKVTKYLLQKRFPYWKQLIGENQYCLELNWCTSYVHYSWNIMAICVHRFIPKTQYYNEKRKGIYVSDQNTS